jgi:hypothetical protein
MAADLDLVRAVVKAAMVEMAERDQVHRDPLPEASEMSLLNSGQVGGSPPEKPATSHASYHSRTGVRPSSIGHGVALGRGRDAPNS